jgi:hypothetical protein
VSRLQEQLQAERDLRAALEVGLSMSSGQFSSARSTDLKVPYHLQSSSHLLVLFYGVSFSYLFYFRQGQNWRRLLLLRLMLQG